MENLSTIAAVIAALGIFNVWLLRFNKATNYRGGDAKNMSEEFAVYGLSPRFLKVIGFLKITFAVLLLAGLAWPALTKPAAIGLGILMMGAVLMHVKVHDSFIKFVPASAMLALCLVAAFA